ncbi:hypothetical protein QJS04_geneDACA021195 [Acorus gramineus]|uniref:VQ domain-containing protein n=1 Tax=Acorus gramineus TaxID=55184 RepID=A0AAV9AJ32_ACOGR|nr:hypothetical protein QJS04_geneDACA021195 [Acorus gramineus]
MDSGNSGSLQSSSGGDEEYDSRSDSFSAFLGGGGGGGVGPPPPPPSNHHHHLLHNNNNNNQSTLFDSLYFDPFPRSPPPDPRLYSDPISSTLLSPPTHRPINPLPQPPPPPPPPPPSSAAPPPQPSRNAKKRSRASRRAPTTVLTTDTSNFRAMVQEFTGIPAQPFSAAAAAASVFPRGGRFDLFSAVRSDPPFLLRPFAQKAQTIPSSFTGTTATTTTTSTAAAAAASTANPNSLSNNYQLSWASQNQDLLNMHNQMFSLQSLLQQPNHPNLPVFGSSSSSKSMSEHPPPQQQQLKMGDYVAGSSSSAAAAPSEFQPQKAAAEMGSSRVPGEGMVDSWICSSD